MITGTLDAVEAAGDAMAAIAQVLPGTDVFVGVGHVDIDVTITIVVADPG